MLSTQLLGMMMMMSECGWCPVGVWGLRFSCLFLLCRQLFNSLLLRCILISVFMFPSLFLVFLLFETILARNMQLEVLNSVVVIQAP